MSHHNEPTKANSLYKKRKKLYSKVIQGASNYWRIVCGILIYGVFIALPWIYIGEQPAIYFDLGARQFHIFYLTFWPQDFMFLAWFLIISAFSLFLFTSVAGRLWCGYVCPQTIWTLLYIWIEEKIEGSPQKRRRLDKSPYSHKKLFLKFTKHSIWLAIAFFTGTTFVSYFYPSHLLYPEFLSLELPTAAAVSVFVFTYLTYLDAAWLREHVCIYMCPYAKFQSVMYDDKTLLVSYNAHQGEPRGKLKSDNRGQCIDCKECVHVCPTGIDIRDGVQIECINCALCLDICNDVMLATNQTPDLITFTNLASQEACTQASDKPQNAKHILLEAVKRPRTLAYLAMLAVFSSLFIYQITHRSFIEASVIPVREPIYRQLSATKVGNDYNIKIANKSSVTRKVVLKSSSANFLLAEQKAIVIPAHQTYEANIRITSEADFSGPRPFEILIQAIAIQQDGQTNNSSTDKFDETVSIDTRFVFPSKRP